MNAGVRALTAAAVLGLAGLAAAGQPEKSAGAGTASSSNASNAANAANANACRTLLKAMAGEWEGTIQTRNGEGMSSSSVVSATVRLEDSGRKLALYYEGFAFGKAADGAMMLAAGDGSPQGAISRDGATLSGAGRQDGAKLAFTFDAPAGSRKIDGYEQVVTLSEPNRLVAELHSVDATGAKSLVVKLEMVRLEGEQKSAAAESLSQGKTLLASARGAIGKLDGHGAVQQAGVPTE